MSRNLASDIARCNGDGSDAEGWREGCETCLRRTAPRPKRVVMISPPPIIAFWCEFQLPPILESYDPKKHDQKDP